MASRQGFQVYTLRGYQSPRDYIGRDQLNQPLQILQKNRENVEK